jgi:molybdate transport repressor ModE-like protein
MLRDYFPSVTLRQLEVFLAVAQSGGFTQAADRVALSEPAVSAHIKELERVFGRRLLNRVRGRRGVTLTPAGQVLFEACSKAFTALNEGARALSVQEDAAPRAITVGVSPTFGGYVLPAVYEGFRHLHPDLPLRISVARRPTVLQGLLEEDLDLGVFTDPVDDARLALVPLRPYQLVLVGPPDHRLAAGPTVPFTELANERLIVANEHSAPKRALERLAAEQGVRLSIALELGDLDTLIQSVVSGLGITALSLPSVAQRIADGRLALLQVEGFPVHSHWYLAHMRRPLRPDVEALREYLLQHC